MKKTMAAFLEVLFCCHSEQERDGFVTHRALGLYWRVVRIQLTPKLERLKIDIDAFGNSRWVLPVPQSVLVCFLSKAM